MGSMSVNKLGGLSLIVGPVVAVISFLIRPGGGIIGGNVDPANSAASIGVLLQNSGLAGISFLLLTLGLIVMIFGISVLVNNLKDGEGLALGRIGLMFGIFAQQSYGAVYAASLGVNTLASIIAAIGFTFIAWGVLASGKYNKKLTLLVLIVQLVVLVASIMGGNDSSFLKTAAMIGGGGYVITVIWTVMIGCSMMNEKS